MMAVLVGDDYCSSCGEAVKSHDGVHLTSEDSSEYLCSRCYNERMANDMDVNFSHVQFDPMTMTDLDGVSHTFIFRVHLFGEQLALNAIEETVDGYDGYTFAVIEDAEQDLFVTFRSLFQRMRRELGRRHIEDDGAEYRITDNDVVRAQISSDPDEWTRIPLLIIDGKPVRWEEFGRMLTTYEGFRFKLEIFDPSEEK